MATETIPQSEPTAVPLNEPRTPRLEAGDRLTQAEFRRRYEAMPDVDHAELIEGVVYMGSPVSMEFHGRPHLHLGGWLTTYIAKTDGVDGGDNATLWLDADNAPQPDLMLRLDEARGGQSKIVDGYVEGAPELVAEIAASSVSYDLHDKLNAYRRNGVKEYVVWRVLDRAVDWFVLKDGRFEELAPVDGVFESQVFPGLRLNVTALIDGNLKAVLAELEQA